MHGVDRVTSFRPRLTAAFDCAPARSPKLARYNTPLPIKRFKGAVTSGKIAEGWVVKHCNNSIPEKLRVLARNEPSMSG